MIDIAFDILDELYFVQTFHYLQDTLKIEKELLKRELWLLLQKGWIKCLEGKGIDMVVELKDGATFEQQYQNYSYLATKEGLFAHHTK